MRKFGIGQLLLEMRFAVLRGIVEEVWARVLARKLASLGQPLDKFTLYSSSTTRGMPRERESLCGAAWTRILNGLGVQVTPILAFKRSDHVQGSNAPCANRLRRTVCARRTSCRVCLACLLFPSRRRAGTNEAMHEHLTMTETCFPFRNQRRSGHFVNCPSWTGPWRCERRSIASQKVFYERFMCLHSSQLPYSFARLVCACDYRIPAAEVFQYLLCFAVQRSERQRFEAAKNDSARTGGWFSVQDVLSWELHSDSATPPRRRTLH